MSPRRAPALDRAPLAVDPRIAARRDAVQADRRHRRRRRIGLVLALVAVVAGAWLITRTALLDVDHVEVHGTARTSADDVLAASGIRPGDQLTDLDGGAAARSVEALPWVADATVDQRWNGLVTVTVTERTPFATVPTADGGRALVDAQGRVLGPDEGDPALVPVNGVVAGAPGEQLPPEASGALELAGLLTPGVRSRVLSIEVGPDGTLTLPLTPQGTALVGDATDLDAKVESLRLFLSQVVQDDLDTVDVSIPGQFTVTRVGEGNQG